MDGSIRLSPKERKVCLKMYRSARPARRALILLLLADEHSYRQIGKTAFASPTLVAAVKRDFHAGGLAGVLPQESPEVSIASWLIVVTRWLLRFTPQDFGFFRSRWSCELLALLLPEHDTKLRQIQRFIGRLPANETVVFQDEVDVHLNPKIGSMWMPRGDQAEVVTPGNNEKRHLAGSLHWRTGRLLLSAPGRRRNAELFIAHLDDLRRQLRGYRVIHVVCDNARFHDCRAIRAYLIRHTGRLVLHYLPKYAPQTNPIERVWWHLHETITRNHRCQSIDELLNEVSDWADTQQTFYLQTESFRTLYSLAA
jgi:putative transposase